MNTPIERLQTALETLGLKGAVQARLDDWGSKRRRKKRMLRRTFSMSC